MKRGIFLAILIATSIVSIGDVSAEVSLSIGNSADLSSKAAKKAITKIERSYLGRYSGTVQYVPGRTAAMHCPADISGLTATKVKIDFTVSKLLVDDKTSGLILIVTNHDPLSLPRKLTATIKADGTFQFQEIEFAATGYTFYEFFKKYSVKPKGSKAKVNYVAGTSRQPHFLTEEGASGFESSCTARAYKGTIKRSKLKKAKSPR